MFPSSTNEYIDLPPPGFEDNPFLSQSKAELSHISQIKWECPPRVMRYYEFIKTCWIFIISPLSVTWYNPLQVIYPVAISVLRALRSLYIYLFLVLYSSFV